MVDSKIGERSCQGPFVFKSAFSLIPGFEGRGQREVTMRLVICVGSLVVKCMLLFALLESASNCAILYA